MRTKERHQGRFLSTSGLQKLVTRPGGRYELVIIDGQGRPVSHLTEWYRLRKGYGSVRTRQTYLDMLLPFTGFLLSRGLRWNDSPPVIQEHVLLFLRESLKYQTRPDFEGDGYLIDAAAQTPLAPSSVRVFLAALRDFYLTMHEAGLYAYPNPMSSQVLTREKRDWLRQVEHAGAPDQAGIRGESWEDSRRFPTAFFRQGKKTAQWIPDVRMETAGFQQRVRDAFEWMLQHPATQRDRLVFLLLRYTGVRLHEILGLTAGGYRQAGLACQAYVVNKGSYGRETKRIYFTEAIDCALITYIRTERAACDCLGRKRLDELEDADPIFLNDLGKSYLPDAFRYHWRKLMERASQQFSVTFSPHTLRHLFVTEYLRYIKREAGENTARYVELADGFQMIMGWQSPSTMRVYDHSFQCGETLKVLAAVQTSIEQGEKDVPTQMEPREPLRVQEPVRIEQDRIEDDENLAFWEEEP